MFVGKHEPEVSINHRTNLNLTKSNHFLVFLMLVEYTAMHFLWITVEVNRISQAISLVFGTVSSSEENLFFKSKIRNVTDSSV